MSCHTETGIRYDASQSHGTGWTANPVAPLVNTVPENSSVSGTTPSPTECR